MSTRWMVVQFVGDTLRLPIVNKPDMDKPFGSSELEREVRRIVVNPFSDNPQTFVPEVENDRLREVVSDGEENARLILHESRMLQAENAQLKQEIEQWHRLTAGIELPEYPITEFKPKDIERENAKLRELLTDYFNAPCVECNPWDEGWQGCKHCDSGNCNLAVRALKLGVEVDNG